MSNLTPAFFDTLKPKMLSVVDESTFTKEISFALQHIGNNPTLSECSHESLLKAVYNVALTGLSLSPIHKFAYLVPRFTRGGKLAVLEPSYQGLVKLLTDTGSVQNVYSHLVYKEDEFEVSLGTSAEIIHKPKFKSKEISHVYAIAILNDGSKQFEVMDIDQLHEIREHSESYKAFKAGKIKQCFWIDHEGEMCRKTVIKRLTKYLPKTDKWDNLSQAIQVDNEDYIISHGQQDYLLSLLHTSAYDDERKQQLQDEILSGMNQTQFSKLLTNLEGNQLDRVNSGMTYGQNDLHKHLDNRGLGKKG